MFFLPVISYRHPISTAFSLRWAWTILSATYSVAGQRQPSPSGTDDGFSTPPKRLSQCKWLPRLRLQKLEARLQEALQTSHEADSPSDRAHNEPHDAALQQSNLPEALMSVGAFQSAELGDYPLVIRYGVSDSNDNGPVLQGHLQ